MNARLLAWLVPAALAACSEQATDSAAENTAPAAATIAAGAENSLPAAPAAAADPAEPCAITGESTDDDLGGLRVHSEPSLDSPEIGRLYPGADPESVFHDDGDGLSLVGAQFTIDRVAGDWLHVTDVDPISDGMDPPGRRGPALNFTGTGWVHKSKVRLLLTDVVAHERPDPNSPVVAAARFSSGDPARLLLECRGRWAHLEYEPYAGEAKPARPITGWVPSESNRAHAEIMREALEREQAAR